ncbi:glycerophosphodiester phosphodiesterase [Mycetocola sp.]|uniref:glycerophosphodiester phosphodiesterase n=1 Tax=Mycetocola sp. TaxID=1871042 RepID=UPI00398A2A50
MTGEGLGRRQFVLGGAAALLLLPSCARTGTRIASPTPSTPSTPAAPQPVSTISELFALAPFYIAHRGSGDNWPEHTAVAYRNAAEAGAQAIEISVNATSDGILVCHHDTNTWRMTGVDREIGRTTWEELSGLKNNATAWLGPSTPLEPIPLLRDVLDELAADGRRVIFVEDKQGTNTRALLDLLDSYPDSTEHFVWKQWAGARQHQLAQERGYTAWGYFTSEIQSTESVIDSFDYLGVFHTAPDEFVADLVSTGKPVIAWEVHYRSVRDRLAKLGVVGMMCSNIPYVTATAALAARDTFATGMRAAGDLPWTVDLGWGVQPKLTADAGTVLLDYAGNQSYLMGSFAPIDASSFEISFRIRWPKVLPADTQHAGISFGVENDRPYRLGFAGDVSGYHAVLRADGSLELHEQAKGTAEGNVLDSVQTPAPAAGEWIDLVVAVSEARIAVSRDRNLSWEAAVDDARYRGGYFWLCKNYAEPVAVEYSSVIVE